MRLYVREFFARIYCFQTQSNHLTSVVHFKSFKAAALGAYGAWHICDWRELI